VLIRGLGEPVVERKLVNGVAVLQFVRGTQLLAASLELSELSKAIHLESDRKVLIDLSKVRMQCHCHAVKNAGVLKLLRPDAPVRHVLNVTKIDSVRQTFEDEAAAIESFGHPT
jgi:hypothetical protein